MNRAACSPACAKAASPSHVAVATYTIYCLLIITLVDWLRTACSVFVYVDRHKCAHSRRFGIPHINAGDLLHAEVARRTLLGIEAQQFMHGSKTVPDRCATTLPQQRIGLCLQQLCRQQPQALEVNPLLLLSHTFSNP